MAEAGIQIREPTCLSETKLGHGGPPGLLGHGISASDGSWVSQWHRCPAYAFRIDGLSEMGERTFGNACSSVQGWWSSAGTF